MNRLNQVNMQSVMTIERQLCRFCGAELTQSVVDLGMSPLCESFVPMERQNEMEPFYPLHVKVCTECFLVQIDEYVSPSDIFTEYAYFSSYSDSWLKHASDYVDMITSRLGLGQDSFVVELASNDGYLLRNFVVKKIPCLGVEPAANVAKVAEEVGVPVLVDFFGSACAAKLRADGCLADLVIGNNVLAQVPTLNDFVSGIKIILKPGGVATLEFPHLMKMMERCEYDTIYHEHFCYFSWIAVERIFAAHGLRLFDVEELASHGGSIRVYACHTANKKLTLSDRALSLRKREIDAGFEKLNIYAGFGEAIRESKRSLLEFLIEAKRLGKKVVGYGAPGKGNTLLNYCGIRTDFLDFTVDKNPHKNGKVLPGTHIPIYPVEKIDEARPDYLLILPWNLEREIINQMAHVREWGCRFVIPVPLVKVID